MALFSGERVGTWSGYPMYGTLYGDVSRSGNTVTISNITCSYSCTNAWGTDGNFWGELRNGYEQLDRTTGLTMSNGSGSQWFYNCSFTVGPTDTFHELNFRTSDGYTVWFNVYFPSGQSAPSTPTCSASSNSSTLVNVSWGVSSLGNPAGTATLYAGTTNNPTELMYTVSTVGTRVFGHDQRTPNTEYFYKAVATNSIGTKTSAVTSAITYPANIVSATVTNNGSTSATISVECGASGSALATELQSSPDGTNWDAVAYNVQGTTQDVVIPNLQPETSYTQRFRVHTTAGNSSVVTVTWTTPPQSKFYCPVNGNTKRVKKLYGSVNGQTKEIKKLYGSVNGQTKLIFKS